MKLAPGVGSRSNLQNRKIDSKKGCLKKPLNSSFKQDISFLEASLNEDIDTSLQKQNFTNFRKAMELKALSISRKSSDIDRNVSPLTSIVEETQFSKCKKSHGELSIGTNVVAEKIPKTPTIHTQSSRVISLKGVDSVVKESVQFVPKTPKNLKTDVKMLSQSLVEVPADSKKKQRAKSRLNNTITHVPKSPTRVQPSREAKNSIVQRITYVFDVIWKKQVEQAIPKVNKRKSVVKVSKNADFQIVVSPKTPSQKQKLDKKSTLKPVTVIKQPKASSTQKSKKPVVTVLTKSSSKATKRSSARARNH